MGDISNEPSMEEILSSIKRIIAEEGDTPARARRPARPAGPGARTTPAEEEVLELNEPVAEVEEPMPAKSAPASQVATAADPIAEPTIREAAARVDSILSDRAAEASRQPLEALSRMIVRPEGTASTSADNTLEGLVRELLKPMLRDWLDANLPSIVETMVAKEIARISGR